MSEKYNEIIVIIFTGSFFILFLAIIIILAVVKYNRRQEKHRQEKNIMKTQFEQELLQTQIEIQSQTLQTIGQEIHDNVGQVLSLAKLNLGTFQDSESEFNQTKINNTKQLVSKAINDLRDLSRSLYANKIAELGLAEAINNELKVLQNSGQFTTSFKIIGEPFKIEPQKEVVIYRMLQESLNNAIKHSKAQNINVVLSFTLNLFTLNITDDGIGFETGDLPEANPGMGLKSMQSRAALIAAKFSVQSSKNNGTSIYIELPT